MHIHYSAVNVKVTLNKYLFNRIYHSFSFIVDQPGQNCTGDPKGVGEASPGAHELAGLQPDAAHIPGQRSGHDDPTTSTTVEIVVKQTSNRSDTLSRFSVFRVTHTGQSKRLLCHVDDGELWLYFAAVLKKPEATPEGHVESRTIHKVVDVFCDRRMDARLKWSLILSKMRWCFRDIFMVTDKMMQKHFMKKNARLSRNWRSCEKHFPVGKRLGMNLKKKRKKRKSTHSLVTLVKLCFKCMDACSNTWV